ncbi:MAG: HD domain-containing protein [Chloroflexi bacterium]|nr:HD domain-containing protein [Chloroflexota bacterium]
MTHQSPSFLENDFAAHQRPQVHPPAREGRKFTRREPTEFFLYRFSCTNPPRFEYLSPDGARLLGYTAEELFSNPALAFSIVHPEDRELFGRIQQGRDLKGPVLMRWMCKNGAILWAEHHFVPNYDEKGSLVSIEAMARQVTPAPRLRQAIEPFLDRLVPFSEALNRPYKMSDVTEVIGKGALALSGANRAAVYAYNPENQITQLWSQGLSSSGLAHLLAHLHAEPVPSGNNQRDPWFSSNLADAPQDQPWKELVDAEGIQAMAICPITYDQRVLASVDCYYDQPHTWSEDEKEALEVFSLQAAAALENTRLYQELDDIYSQTVLSLARTINARDAYTAEHSRRLASWAEATARMFNLSPKDIQTIRWAAMLHDIGKIGIPDSILRKAGPLSDEEWEVMKRHPEMGADIIAPLKSLRPVTPIVRAHQEKFDGSGYPDGLAGEQIPLAARIITVVDAYGAMTDNRVYRKALTHTEAVDELKRCIGKQFDGQVVEAFFQVMDNQPIQ